jgi:arsenate reductase (thioredoxin)
MAEAFAKIFAADQVESFSAGSKPSGKINHKAVQSMNELGYDLTKHSSKSLEEIKQFAPFDVVVTMGCGDACPWMPAKSFVDWDILDPKEMSEDEFRKVRDLIGDKVRALVGEK